MELKIGDIVEFKKYEDMTDDENLSIPKDRFPKSGKVREVMEQVDEVLFFFIEKSTCVFSSKSIARVISDVDINSLKRGDEVLVKAMIKDTFNEFAELIPLVEKSDILKKIKRKEPEHFIVKEDYYGMYIGLAQELVQGKGQAKIYTSRNTANDDAADMHLNAWEVITYE